MDRLADALAAARNGQRKLLCPFLTAGYPSLEITPDLLLAAEAGGAGIIELGIPFSDPVADGPVIQASFTEALTQGTTVQKALGTVAGARKRGLKVPVMAMVSFSIIFKRGTREFAAMCAGNGLDGIILPDIPLEEAPGIVDAIRDAGLRSSLLVAPTTPAGRREAIARLCDGFIYYLSVSGITGERKALPADIGPNVAALREVTQSPICVGFGISTPEQVREVTQIADGAIVGSALIRRIAEHAKGSAAQQAQAVKGFVENLATGLA
jgi:tryptophan synthase alpha chain